MPDCRAVKKKLGRYFDAELQPVEHRSVEDHLKHCSRCRVELQETREVAGAFQEGMSAPPVPSDLAQRIMEKTRAQVGIARPEWGILGFWKNWSLSMRFASVAVAAVACYIGIVIGGASLPTTGQESDEMKWVSMTSQGPIVSAYIGGPR